MSTRLYYNYGYYTKEWFEQRYPDVKLETTADQIEEHVIRTIANNLEIMPPEVKKSIKGIEIIPEKDWKRITKERFGYTGGDAYATEDGVLHFHTGDLILSHFYHEAGHTLTNTVEGEQSAKQAEANWVGKILGDIVGVRTFKTRWKEIAGDLS